MVAGTSIGFGDSAEWKAQAEEDRSRKGGRLQVYTRSVDDMRSGVKHRNAGCRLEAAGRGRVQVGVADDIYCVPNACTSLLCTDRGESYTSAVRIPWTGNSRCVLSVQRIAAGSFRHPQVSISNGEDRQVALRCRVGGSDCR